MDLTSKNMYDTFKDEIWKELGPLDPNWFEVLTAQACPDEGTVSDQEDLCANQEGHFKPTSDKTEVDSQLFSTPKVFRHRRIVSPQTEDERSFTTEQEKGILPWMATQSPHVFPISKQGVIDTKYGGLHPQSHMSFDLLHTPHKSPTSYAKHISESLGAQINPDVSWTSSLNTPPAVPSTLILSKNDKASPCPVSISAEKDVVFVRKLFPSLSNPSTAKVTPCLNGEIPPAQQGAVSPEVGPADSPNQSGGVWRQKLPEAVEDGELCGTVSSVLDGAENVPSIFFANSGSALRKVKPDRIRPKQIFTTKEHSPSSAHVPAATNNPASGRGKPVDHKTQSVSSDSPAPSADHGLSQWSPLSLSELPASAQQWRSDSDVGRIVRPPAKASASGFTKKKRTFVYTIAASKQQVQSKDSRTQMMDSGQHPDVKQLGKAPGSSSEKTDAQQQGSVALENLPPPVQAKDLDMSQLCKEFAQDFSQTSDSDKMHKVTEDSQSHFSPLACLSAVKQSKQKTRREHLQAKFDGFSNGKTVSLTDDIYSINEGVAMDSGFQSAVADITPMPPSSVIPSCTGNTLLSHLCSKGDIHGTSTFPSTNKEDNKVNIDGAAVIKLCNTLRTQLEERWTQDPRDAGSLTAKRLPNSATVDNNHCVLLNEKPRGSLTERTSRPQPSLHTSGFKTASNKGIHISSANLERAKILFEETESGKTLNSQSAKSDGAIKQQMSRSNKSERLICNSNQLPSLEGAGDTSCQLTESQKADVTELCTLLEEAESQFEFTQLKTSEMNSRGHVTSPPRTDKELDADFLTGIDFDDSFPSDAERHLTPDKTTANKAKCGASNVTGESQNVPSPLRKVQLRDQAGPSSCVHPSEGSTSVTATKPQNLRRVEKPEPSRLESKDPSMLGGVAFKSAGGNILTVSKAGLSKARALFADLEKLTDVKSADSQVDSKRNCSVDSIGGKEDLKVTSKADHRIEERAQTGLSNMAESFPSDKDATDSFNNSKMVTPACQSGFHMASGKSISIPAKYIQQAHALFKDCDLMERNSSMLVKGGQSSGPVAETINRNNLMMESSISDDQTSGISHFGNVNARLLHHRKTPHAHNEEMGSTSYNGSLTAQKAESYHGKPSSTSKPFSSPSCAKSKDIDSSAVNEFSKVDGFCTASGKKVTESMNRAEYLLNECSTPEDTYKTNGQKESTRKAGQLCGGGVAISSAALKKAKAMMRECHEVDDFSEKPQQSQMAIQGPPPGKGGFASASGKPVTLSSAAILKAKALFSDIDASPNADTKSSDSKQGWSEKTKPIHPVLNPPVEENVQGPQCCLLKSKTGDSVSARDCMDSRKTMPINTGENQAYLNGTGHNKKTFSDLKPDQRVTVNISEEPGSGSIKDINDQVKQKANPQNGGFQTASGKTIPVSCEAMKKATTLLSECEDVEGEVVASTSHFKAPVPGPSSRNGGFVAASGKQVAVSSEALQRAKALFSDISLSAGFQAGSEKRTRDKEEDGGNTETVHCGFTTAGQKVHVSKKKLFKAKHLKEFESVSTSIIINQSDVDGGNGIPVNPKENGEPVGGRAVEERNRSKPKPDQRDIVNIPKECGSTGFEGINEHETQFKNTFPTPSGGFQTASGKDVAISSVALRKAETLLGEYEGVEDESMRLGPHFKAPVAAPSPRNNGFVAASGKQVTVSSEALRRANALFGDIGLSADLQAGSDAKKSDGEQGMHCGFKTARGQKVHVSQKSLLKAERFLKEFDDSVSTNAREEADCFTKDFDMDGKNNMSVRQEENGPSMNSGGEKNKLSDLKPGHSTEINMPRNPGNGGTEDANKQVKQKSNTSPTQSDGFQTAGGNKVTVSSEALRKAKTLLSEEDENKIVAAAPHFKVPVPVPAPSSRNCGFRAASGKKVPVSSKALQRAKALFSDISASADLQAGSGTRTRDDELDGGENPELFSGFTTAGGTKVHVSQNNLLKAKRVLEEIDSLTDQHDPLNLDPSKENKLNHITPGDKNMSLSECAGLGGKSFNSTRGTEHADETAGSSSGCFMKGESSKDPIKSQDNITPATPVNLHLESRQEQPNVLKCDVNQSSCRKDSSLLNFQSVHLTGCTETQQDFLAQEAIDCTKALLEDESLAGQSFSPTSEFIPFPGSPNSSKRSSKWDKGKGKRSLLLDDLADNVAQPPLKRRLLEQFDKTVDGSRSSTLQPMKSCPNVLKDRGVFKYTVSLHPNVTRPHRSGQNHVEHKVQSTNRPSTSGGDKSAHSKMAAFVPPFISNARTDTRGNVAVRDKPRAPVFVPPFKKQSAHVRENSEIQRQDEGEEGRPFVKSSDCGTFVPPAKKTDRGEDGAVLADAASGAMMASNQDLPVAGGSASSDTQSSCGDETRKDLIQDLLNTELARDMQDMRIRKKKRQTVRPLPGSLFLTKTSGVARIPLKVAANGKAPAKHTPTELYGSGVHWHVCEITSATAESFRFNLPQFVKREALVEGGGVQLGDGGWLIPSDDGTAGKEEFYRALCDTPGVDPKLLSEAWVYNHYRWIVWKQASMERSFPETMGSRCLTPEQVLLQLKYRYDVEVDHSRRPALRKILEKDDTAAKTLVLCVSEIVSASPSANSNNDAKTPQGGDAKVQTPGAVVRLTDGWYPINAQLDEPLTAMLRRGRLAVGGKLIVHGAQLLGSPDARPPLEAPESVMLKICANSCRPVRWAVKLGFYKDPRPFLLPVSCLFSNGGPVGCVDIVLLRSYPVQWMERKADGGVVFRSVRAEEKEARRHNGHRQKSMEALFAKIQAEFEREEKGSSKPQRRRRPRSYQDLTALQEGEELYEAAGDDPAYLEAHLSEQQLEALHTYRRSLMEKKQTELQERFRCALEAEDTDMNCPKRDVTPVWRLCVADSLDQTSKVYQLNLWRPSSDLQCLLKEGRRYKVYNLTTSEGKKRSGIEGVQLTGTKKTQFQDLQASPGWLSARFQPRVTTSFVNLHNPDYQPLCGEVDVTGCVTSVIDEHGSSPAFYLADGELNFVKVRCFGSFSQSGLEDVVKARVLLALSNLQLRGQSMCPTPVVYAGDLTVFSTNPKEVHLQESLGKMKTRLQCQANFFQMAEEKLSYLMQVGKSGTLSCFPAALQPQTPTPTTDTMARVTSHKPIRSLGSFTPVSRNPPAATSSSEKDPRNLKRKRALDYLSHMPPPPPLSHMSSLASPSVNKTFNPPRRSGTPSTLKTVPTPRAAESLQEKEWVKDEELAMIDTQALHVE